MENCYQTTKKILSLLKIKHTNKYINDSILSHPDHPSLLSISDTLEKYHIESIGIKIQANKLNEIPLPCIVQVEKGEKPLFFVLKSINDDSISYFDEKNKLIKTRKINFLEIWTGICLLVETSENSKEIDIENKLISRKILNFLKGSILFLLLTWMSLSFFNTNLTTNSSSIAYAIAYAVLKIVGIITGIMLLWFEVDQYNPIIQNFCSGSSKKINCNSVLSSEHSKLFKGALSLGLLGFSYFLGTFTYLIFNSFSSSALSILGLFSFVSIPIILLSIYYQAIVIKQWCKFCVIIQVSLLGEILISYLGDFYTNISYDTMPALFLFLLIPILGWKLLKPLLEERKKINLLTRKYGKIKNNPNVLEALLMKSRKISTSPKGLGISFNKKPAKYNVIKVCSPYCGPCASAHPILEDLVNKGKINLQILFSVSNEENDLKTKPVSHFLAIDEKGNKNTTQHALDNWYLAKNKDYEAFSQKYPMNGELVKQKDKIEAMNSWCEKEKITHTPTIFINGYELPKEYSVKDLQDVLL
jgi:uncharacterized membrane protein